MLIIALHFDLNECGLSPDNILELRNGLVSSSIFKINCSSNQNEDKNVQRDHTKKYQKLKPFIQYVKFNNAYKISFSKRSCVRIIWSLQSWQGKRMEYFLTHQEHM